MKRIVYVLIALSILASISIIPVFADSEEKSDARKTIERIVNASKGIENEPETDDEEDPVKHIDFEVHEESFSTDLALSFAVYDIFQQAGEELGNFTQILNPELSFDVKTQTVDSIRFYLNYYGNCTKKEAVEILESDTDELVYIINNAFPNVDFEFVNINWKIPAIDEESYYAATYYCYKENDEVVRGDGSGLIYLK